MQTEHKTTLGWQDQAAVLRVLNLLERDLLLVEQQRQLTLATLGLLRMKATAHA